MPFPVTDLTNSQPYKDADAPTRVAALDEYFSQAQKFFVDDDAGDRKLNQQDQRNLRSSRDQLVQQEAMRSLIPKAIERARIATGSNDPAIIQAKAVELTQKSLYGGDQNGPDLTAPKPVMGAQKVLQDKLIERRGFKGSDFDEMAKGNRHQVLKDLFLTNAEVIGEDFAKDVKAVAKLTGKYSEIDQTVDLGDDAVLHIRDNPDLRRDDVTFSFDSPRLKGKFPVTFDVSRADLGTKTTREIIAANADKLRAADERGIFSDLSKSIQSGALSGVAATGQGLGDVLTTGLLQAGAFGADENLEVPRLLDEDSSGNPFRGIEDKAQSIRGSQSLDTQVARNFEDALFTPTRLADIFGQGIGQLGVSMLSGGIGGLGVKAGSSALIGKAAIAKVAKAGFKVKTKAGSVVLFGEAAVEAAAKARVKKGFIGGSLTSNFGQISSGATDAALSLGAKPADARLAGHISGLFGAPLETVADVAAAKLLTGRGVKYLAQKGLITNVLRSAGFQALVEGGTEAAQQMIQNGTLKTMINDELGITDGVLESAVAGALVGLATGGVGGGIAHYKGGVDPKLNKPLVLTPDEGRAVDDDYKKDVNTILTKKPEEGADYYKVLTEEFDGDETLAKGFMEELAAKGLVAPLDPANTPEENIAKAKEASKALVSEEEALANEGSDAALIINAPSSDAEQDAATSQPGIEEQQQRDEANAVLESNSEAIKAPLNRDIPAPVEVPAVFGPAPESSPSAQQSTQEDTVTPSADLAIDAPLPRSQEAILTPAVAAPESALENQPASLVPKPGQTLSDFSKGVDFREASTEVGAPNPIFAKAAEHPDVQEALKNGKQRLAESLARIGLADEVRGDLVKVAAGGRSELDTVDLADDVYDEIAKSHDIEPDVFSSIVATAIDLDKSLWADVLSIMEATSDDTSQSPQENISAPLPKAIPQAPDTGISASDATFFDGLAASEPAEQSDPLPAFQGREAEPGTQTTLPNTSLSAPADPFRGDQRGQGIGPDEKLDHSTVPSREVSKDPTGIPDSRNSPNRILLGKTLEEKLVRLKAEQATDLGIQEQLQARPNKSKVRDGLLKLIAEDIAERAIAIRSLENPRSKAEPPKVKLARLREELKSDVQKLGALERDPEGKREQIAESKWGIDDKKTAISELVGRDPLKTQRAAIDAEVAKAFERRVDKLRADVASRVKEGTLSKDEALVFNAQLNAKLDAGLTKRQKAARAESALVKQETKAKKKANSRPNANIEALAKRRVKSMVDSGTAVSSLSPAEFSAYLADTLLFKEEDVSSKENLDSTFTVSIEGVALDRASKDTGVTTRAELNPKNVLPGGNKETAAVLDGPGKRPAIGSLNSQISVAAIEWYWKQPNRQIVPVETLIAPSPVDNIVARGAAQLYEVASYFGNNLTDATKGRRATTANPEQDLQRVLNEDGSKSDEFEDVSFTSDEAEANRVAEGQELDDFDSETASFTQDLARWQSKIQRIAADVLAAYNNMTRGIQSGDRTGAQAKFGKETLTQGNLEFLAAMKSAPILFVEEIEFATYARLRTAPDGAPLQITEADVQLGLLDVLVLSDQWLANAYKAASGDPAMFREMVASGDIPPSAPNPEKPEGNPSIEWNAPPEMPESTRAAIEGIGSPLHKGIMGDFWEAMRSLKKHLREDTFISGNPDFNVGDDAGNLRKEFLDSNSVRRLAFDRAIGRGLTAAELGVVLENRSDQQEVFRSYILQALIARDRFEAGTVDVLATITNADDRINASGYNGNVDGWALDEKLGTLDTVDQDADLNSPEGLGTTQTSFTGGAVLESDTSFEGESNPGIQRRQEMDMKTGVLGDKYAAFMERVRGGLVTGKNLADRIIEATRNPDVAAIVQSLKDKIPGLSQVRVRSETLSIDSLGEVRSSIESPGGTEIIIDEGALASDKVFTQFLTEELIHAASFVATVGNEKAEPLRLKALDKVKAANKKNKKNSVVDALINNGLDRTQIQDAYRDGKINKDQLSILYALSNGAETLAHAAITPAFQRFLVKNGLWSQALNMMTDAFGKKFTDKVNAFSNNWQDVRDARQKAAATATAAKRPHHTPSESKAVPPDDNLFAQAWSSENPREFLANNLKGITLGLRSDLDESQKVLYAEQGQGIGRVLSTAPDPAPPTTVIVDGKEVTQESRQAIRLRIAIASLFNTNINPGIAYRMAFETLGSKESTQGLADIGQGQALTRTTAGLNNSLVGTQAIQGDVARTKAGLDLAEKTRRTLQRGLRGKHGIGGGGRLTSQQRHDAASKRIEKAAKGLSPLQTLTALMGNQLVSVKEGLSPEEQKEALLDNFKSWTSSVRNKIARGASDRTKEEGRVDAEVLESLGEISKQDTVAKAKAKLDTILNKEQKKFISVVREEFANLRDEVRFNTEIARSGEWEAMNDYLPLIVDDPKSNIYTNASMGTDTTGEGMNGGDGTIGVIDRIGTGQQSASMARRGLSGTKALYYRQPNVSMMLSALSAQMYESETLGERMMIKSMTRADYDSEGDSGKFFPPLVRDLRFDAEGKPMTGGNIENARNAIEGVTAKYYRADRSGMPSGGFIQSTRILMKLAYYKTLVGLDQPLVQMIPAVPAWLVGRGTDAGVMGLQFFKNLGRSLPVIGAQRDFMQNFLSLHANAFATRTADANIEALTRETARLFPSAPGTPSQNLSRAARAGFWKSVGGVEKLITAIGNTLIGGSEKLVLRPILITEYQKNAIKNGTAKDWNDDSIFKDNVDFNALDDALLEVDRIGAPSDPADRGEAFISQGTGVANEIGKIAALAYNGHQSMMASNVIEANSEMRFGDKGKAASLYANVVLQGVLYTALTSFILKPVRDFAAAGILDAIDEEEEADAIRLKRSIINERSAGERLAALGYESINDVLFTINPVLNTPIPGTFGGALVDHVKDQVLDNLDLAPDLQGFYEASKINFNGNASTLQLSAAILGPAGQLVVEAIEDGFMNNIGAGFVPNAVTLAIPERTLRKAVNTGLKAKQARFEDE